MKEKSLVEEFLTTQEVADRLRFSPSHVRKLVASGHIPAIRQSSKGHYRFQWDKVIEAMETMGHEESHD